MILRRMADAIREQNWFTVIIEILIVVIGIFLGLQAANWNDERANREKEAQALDNLRSDFEQMNVRVNRAIDFHKRAFVGLQTVVETLEEGELPDAKRSQFEDGLRYGYRTAAVTAVSSTLAELTSSGQVGLLSDARIRKALTEYELYRESAHEGHRNIRAGVTLYVRDFTAHFNYDAHSNRPGTYKESAWAFKLSEIGEYDFNTMAGDAAFKDAVYELREFQLFDLNWYLNTLKRIEDIRKLLSDGTPAETTQ